jgi:glutamate dehydrogenase (NAD(P)+)
VQGLGNVGGIAARLFAMAGAKIVALQDHSATLVEQAGIDIPKALDHVARHGGLAGFLPNAEVAAEEFWFAPTEFLVPAALEGQLLPERAKRVQTRIVVEGANGPTTPAADDILNDRGILVIPDVLANAGGVTVSYFEWVQDFSSFFWTEEEINARLERIMIGAFDSICAVAVERAVPLRTAAFITACQRVLSAREQRGLYP